MIKRLDVIDQIRRLTERKHILYYITLYNFLFYFILYYIIFYFILFYIMFFLIILYYFILYEMFWSDSLFCSGLNRFGSEVLEDHFSR